MAMDLILHVLRVILETFVLIMQQDIEQDGMQVQEEEAVARTHNAEHFVFEWIIMITTKLLIITTVTTLATLLGSFSVNVYAKDFVDEPNVPDESVPIGGSGGTEQRDTNHEGGTVDFNNGDKGCDNNHNNCQHVNHNRGRVPV
jgi:hypothetical protein